MRGSSYLKDDFTDIVLKNLRAFFIDGFMEKSAYKGITYSDGKSALTPVGSAPTSEFKFFGPTLTRWPAPITELTIDGAPTSTGFTINYEESTVDLDTPASSVSAEYNIPYIDVITSDSDRWKIIVAAYSKALSEGGDIDLSDQFNNRVLWNPTVSIDIDTYNNNTPLQIGGGEISTGLIEFYVFGLNKFPVKKITDLILAQQHSTINIYDTNSVDFFEDSSYRQTIGPIWSKLTFGNATSDIYRSAYGIDRGQVRVNFSVYRPISTYT